MYVINEVINPACGVRHRASGIRRAASGIRRAASGMGRGAREIDPERVERLKS